MVNTIITPTHSKPLKMVYALSLLAPMGICSDLSQSIIHVSMPESHKIKQPQSPVDATRSIASERAFLGNAPLISASSSRISIIQFAANTKSFSHTACKPAASQATCATTATTSSSTGNNTRRNTWRITRKRIALILDDCAHFSDRR